jgi:type I restriction enzyme, S subunit
MTSARSVSLQSGWRSCRLGEATRITSGLTLGRNLNGRQCRLVSYLRVANVKDGFLDLSDVKKTLASEEEIDACRLQAGDVLLTEGGDPDKLGRGTYWQGQIGECLHQNHIFRIRFDQDQFDPAFLALQFRSPYGKSYFLRHAKQTTGIATINQEVLSNFPLLVPPFAEQQKLAASLLTKLTHIESAMEASQLQLREFARLADAIVSSSSQRSTSRRMSLGEVLNEVKDGVGSSWKSHPVLGATREGIAPAKERPGKHAERYKPVTTGTVFYNPMRILIGSIAFVDEDDEPGITSPDYVVLKGKLGVVDSRWFYHWLRSPLGERCIQSLARGAVRERMLFNRLAEGKIELPDYCTQMKASKALAQIKPMRAAIKQQIAAVELLPQKFLAQIFGV